MDREKRIKELSFGGEAAHQEEKPLPVSVSLVPPRSKEDRQDVALVETVTMHDNNCDEFVEAPPFRIDDKVLCHDASARWYPAVIRNMRYLSRNQSWEFFVHFVKWNSRWDRWKSPDDLVHDTPDERASKLPPLPLTQDSSASRTAIATVQAVSDHSSSPVGPATSDYSSRKRKKHQGIASSSLDVEHSAKRSTSSKSASPFPLEEYCELPLTLKIVLWDEWERLNPRDFLCHHRVAAGGNGFPRSTIAATTSRGRTPTRVVHDLPSKATVRYVLSHFRKTAIEKCQEQPPTSEKKGGESAAKAPAQSSLRPSPSPDLASSSSVRVATPAQIRAFCAGLLELFETALPTCLLYPQERPQYEILFADLRHRRDGGAITPAAASNQVRQNFSLESTPLLASVYGCEHLLRLLVRLPALLQVENLSKPQCQWMGPLVADLIVLLQRNRVPIFSKSRYRPPRPTEYVDWERDLYSGGY